jgi:hypothetical protein
MVGQKLSFICLVHALVAGLAVSQDSLTIETVAPGVEHLNFVKSGPYNIHVLKVDLRRENIAVESFRPDSLTATSIQAAQNDRDGRRVLAAINADFFSFQTHWPLGNQVKGGKFIHGASSRRSHFAMAVGKKPRIERLSFRGLLILKDGSVLNIDAINHQLGRDSIVLFNSSWKSGPSKTTNAAVYLQCSVSKWAVGDTVSAVVVRIDTIFSPVFGEEALIAIAGNRLRSVVRQYDPIKVVLLFEPHAIDAAEVVGGGGRILENGEKRFRENVEGIRETFYTERHPRTFVGFDKDSTTLYLCTVDGRQPTSKGMNFDEMADFLLSLGVWNAVNLDGGGSTTMVIRGKVVNSPSDKTGERSVANSLQVVQLE